MFQFCLVKQEEQNILRLIADSSNYTLAQLEAMNTDEISSELISEEDMVELEVVRERLNALKECLKYNDYQSLIEIKNAMGDEKFKLFSGLDSVSADDL